MVKGKTFIGHKLQPVLLDVVSYGCEFVFVWLARWRESHEQEVYVEQLRNLVEVANQVNRNVR